MDILFVPLNPPDISNSHDHYFSRVSTFWDIQYDSELITQKIKDLMKADIQVLLLLLIYILLAMVEYVWRC
jgi:hypothetical protein